MAGPITCNTSPTSTPCLDVEPTPTPTPIQGPPPDPTAIRRAEQSVADDRLASFVEGGMSDSRGASREGHVPVASTTRSVAQRKADWEEHKKGIAARDVPIEYDPYSQALLGAGAGSVIGASLTSAATVAEEAVGHNLVHAAFEFLEHVIHERGVETAERARERAKPPATSTPKPRTEASSCESPLQSVSMYHTRISG